MYIVKYRDFQIEVHGSADEVIELIGKLEEKDKIRGEVEGEVKTDYNSIGYTQTDSSKQIQHQYRLTNNNISEESAADCEFCPNNPKYMPKDFVGDWPCQWCSKNGWKITCK